MLLVTQRRGAQRRPRGAWQWQSQERQARTARRDSARSMPWRPTPESSDCQGSLSLASHGFVRWENLPMDQQTYPFRLSGLGGEVVVQYGRNTDPARWGYELLGLDFASTVAKGFPVLQADVTYEGEGYAAT